MATHATAPVATPEIPNKLYFRIGDVSRIAGVKPYVLRYWETEFPAIGPKKSGSNHRLYRRKDVELILDIKRLLYQERYTIEGARKYLDALHKAETVSRKGAKTATLEIATAAAVASGAGSTTVSSVSVPSSSVASVSVASHAGPSASAPVASNTALNELRAEIRSMLEMLALDPMA